MREKEFQAKVVRLAHILGWATYHTYDSRRSNPGFPDLVLVRDRVLFRELKTNTGELSSKQEGWMEKLTGAGADFAVWRPRDWDEIVDTLKRR